ncbi:hypothetical protein N9H39_10970, partial [Gammaproteobacteria bacterium]|nr:hypothetical protein [Gammaproteobacteria bacterium]
AEQIYMWLFGGGGSSFVTGAFDWFVAAFGGRYHDYQAVDMAYHDREHTLQGALCYVRLMYHRQRSGAVPVVPRHMFELGLIAILLHDSGYLKHNGDAAGTGAKYTLEHVERSCIFARELLSDKGFSADDILKVQRMINCTGLNVEFDSIDFQSKLEKTIGLSVATADLLGQMSALDYVDRIADLFKEFNECWEYSGEPAESLHYDSIDQLLDQTPNFWENYVKHKINTDCKGLYRFLSQPYPDGPNQYIMRIEANIDRVREINAGHQ